LSSIIDTSKKVYINEIKLTRGFRTLTGYNKDITDFKNGINNYCKLYVSGSGYSNWWLFRNNNILWLVNVGQLNSNCNFVFIKTNQEYIDNTIKILPTIVNNDI
jgi:hypothetical protein